MTRMYVIMCDALQDDGTYDTYPIDVASSLSWAEDLCCEYENAIPDNIYYYREVIASE